MKSSSTELSEYIWKNYQHLIDIETDYLKIVRATSGMKFDSEPFPEKIKSLQELGKEKLRERITQISVNDREKNALYVYEKYKDEIILNICSKCEKLVITPNSQSCLHCGHQWYEINKP